MATTDEQKHGKYFKDRLQWRSWLEAHHASLQEIWLIYYKKHSGKKSVQYSEAVEEALCFGWIDSRVKRIDDERYMQKYTPRKAESNWSASNKKRVKRLITEGKMTESGLKMIEIAKANGSWSRLDVIETRMEVPCELSSALEGNEPAKEFFESLSPSYKKQYLWWLHSAKRQETREKRLSEIVRRCEQHIKPGI